MSNPPVTIDTQPTSPAPARRKSPEETLRTLWWIVFALFLSGVLLPLRFGLLRLGLVTGAVLLLAGATYLLRRSRIKLAFLWVPTTLIIGAFIAPGRPTDSATLRTEYVRNLRSLTGIPYIWGAETRVALDCSGLVRYALIETDFREGVRTANPTLLRRAASLWWHDESAEALGQNYRGLTLPIGKARSLNEADYSPLRPGDLAITAGGKHILAYLGDRTWIQADPVPMRVVQSPVPNTSGWFIQRAWFVRWRELD